MRALQSQFGLLFLSLAAFAGDGVAAGTPHPSRLPMPPLNFTPPAVERIQLDCGAPLYLLKDPRLPLFSLYGLARAGSAYDPDGKEGLAALTSHVMRSGGTTRVDADELDRQLEFMGADLATGTNEDAGSMHLSCLSRDIGKALPLTLDMLAHPAFRGDKLELRKEQVREAIRRWDDEPSQTVAREYRRLVYGAHPYAHPVIGEPGSMERISREDLHAFHRAQFNPSGMIFGAAGDFDRDTVVALLNSAFGARKGSAPPPPPPVTRREEPSLNYIARETEQAHLMLGHLGISRDDPDYIPLMVMNEILGGGAFSSRIMERVRSTEGLAYQAASRFTTRLRQGLFYAVCQTKQKSALDALAYLREEIEQIRSVPVGAEELTRAKDSYLHSFVFNFTSAAQCVEQMVDLEFYGLPRDYLRTYLARVAAVTREDILRVARGHLHPARATILILGNATEFSKPLESLGKVHRLNVGDAAVSAH